MIHRYFVTAPRGLVGLLRDELVELGAGSVREEPGGCRVRGPLSFGYRICIGSRCASRVLLGLGEVVAADADGLYRAVREVAWEQHVRAEGTIAVDFVGSGAGIEHSKFGAQKVKDAIVDRMREAVGRRPDVDRDRPDLRVNAFVRGKGCALSIDLSGESLHRRGYRVGQGEAPLKENLAAALLRFAGWADVLESGGALVDPMCGTGTLPIEAALVATATAPGLLRERFGFEGWLGHDAEAWAAVVEEARARVRVVERGRIFGFDRDRRAIELARAAAQRAGMHEAIAFEVDTVARVRAPAERGLVVANPPFGERLGDKASAKAAFGELGDRLVQAFPGWRFAVIATDDDLLPALRCRPEATLAVTSGALEARIARGVVEVPAGDLVNRLRKNLARLAKWRKREDVSCYRLYDADLPEYNAAIDVYGEHAVVAEYEAPAHVDPDRAAARRIEIASAVATVLELSPRRLHMKTRKRQRGASQYERTGEGGASIVVQESGHRLRVRLDDYLDTGLFLHHRSTRRLLAEHASGARFLNLFGYTGVATVYAARAGARATTTVDLSRTYLDWAQENLELNGIRGLQHRLVRADVQQFVRNDRGVWDLIFLDPPTFSNSKAMETTFDVQRDHAELLEMLAPRLAPGGRLLFSTNRRRFTLDDRVSELFAIEDITRATTPPDFARRPPHHAWWLRRRE